MNPTDYTKIPAGFPLERGPVVIKGGKAYPCRPGETPEALCTVPCTTGYVGAIAPIVDETKTTTPNKDKKNGN